MKKILLPLLAAALLTVAVGAQNTTEKEPLGEIRVELDWYGDMAPAEAMSDNTESALQKAIETGIENKAAKIDISAFELYGAEGIERVYAVYTAARNNRPDLIYMPNTYKIRYDLEPGGIGHIKMIELSYDLFYTPEVMQSFSDSVDAALETVKDLDEPLEIAMALHDYLVNQVSYNWEVATGKPAPQQTVYNAYGALVEGDAVCQGYATAYKLLLKECGIESVLLPSDSMNHVWNGVQIDGQWYHVDVTWDDPVPDLPGGNKYEYFMLSDEAMQEKKHYDWEPVVTCDSTLYESGYRFHESSTTIYPADGGYYWVQAYSEQLMFSTSLASDGSERTVSSDLNFFQNRQGGIYYPTYATVWKDGTLYYVADLGTYSNPKPVFCAVALSDGLRYSILPVSFTPAASVDGFYNAQLDGIGLRYDAVRQEIALVSRTRPDTVLHTVDVSYPPQWHGATEALAGARWMGEHTLQIGVSRAGAADMLLVAAYAGTRMVALERVELIQSDSLQSYVCTLPEDKACDSVKLFLLQEETLVPLSESLAA